jgi:hypothetical protein
MVWGEFFLSEGSIYWLVTFSGVKFCVYYGVDERKRWYSVAASRGVVIERSMREHR